MHRLGARGGGRLGNASWRRRGRGAWRAQGARRAAQAGGAGAVVAKMGSHTIFQYNILAIDDTHNTWTNVIVKMTILRLLGSSDDKEKRGVARPDKVLEGGHAIIRWW